MEEGLLLLLLCLSAVFSAAETAFSSASKTRLKLEAENGSRAAEEALALAEDFDRLLAAILVGNNIANILLSTLTAIIFAKRLGEGGVAVATIILTVAVILFGEITPKSLAARKAETVAKALARPLRLLETVLAPVVFIVGKWQSLFAKAETPAMSAEEIGLVIGEAKGAGKINPDIATIMTAVNRIDENTAEGLSSHRLQVSAVKESASRAEALAAFVTSGHSRLVVTEDGNLDHVSGVLSIKKLLMLGGASVKEAMDSPVFVPGCMQATDLLAILSQKQQLAIVVDEYGGTIGVVTLEDVLEELLRRDILDEADKLRR